MKIYTLPGNSFQAEIVSACNYLIYSNDTHVAFFSIFEKTSIISMYALPFSLDELGELKQICEHVLHEVRRKENNLEV